MGNQNKYPYSVKVYMNVNNYAIYRGTFIECLNIIKNIQGAESAAVYRGTDHPAFSFTRGEVYISPYIGGLVHFMGENHG